MLVLKLAEKLRGTKVDFDAARESARSYSPEAWERAIHRAYGPGGGGCDCPGGGVAEE